MEVIKINYKNWPKLNKITLTIGNFDGLHLGHAQLIKKVKEYQDSKHAALTFDPHPQSFLRGSKAYTLMEVDDKIEEFKKFKIDYLLIATFNKEFASLSVETFIKNLKEIGVIRLVLGRDFKFAHRGSGTVEELQKHFEVIVVPDILYHDTRISTTYIKDLLRAANLLEANYLLNKEYQIKGLVKKGNQVGTLMGFPTANIEYNNYLLPKNGVYYTQVIIKNKLYHGITNIGYNPTVNYSVTKKVETYIIDYDEAIYNEEIKLIFIKYLRPEEKFDSVDALIAQMNEDKKQVLHIISSKNMLK